MLHLIFDLSLVLAFLGAFFAMCAVFIEIEDVYTRRFVVAGGFLYLAGLFYLLLHAIGG